MRVFIPTSASLVLSLIACNEPPGAPTVAIEPAEPGTDDVLRVIIASESIDPNKNDTVTYSFRWLLDGAVVGDLTGTEVPLERTARGQNWTVEVTPADDKLAGALASATVTILNSLPTATASITPASPRSTEDLNLVIQTEDADGDTVNTTITWTVDGAPAGIGTERVPADRTVRGQIWEATVTPRDARDVGEAVTASVTIENQAPVMTSVPARADPRRGSERVLPGAGGARTPSTRAFPFSDFLTKVGSRRRRGGLHREPDDRRCRLGRYA